MTRSTPRRRLVALGLLLSMTLIPQAPSAAAGCVSGSAYDASADRPHVLDPSGDVREEFDDWPGRDALDLQRVWISSIGSPTHPLFALHIQVDDLSAASHGTTLHMEFDDAAEVAVRPWMAATYSEQGGWAFDTGDRAGDVFYVGDVYQGWGEVEGEVDLDRNVITMEIPFSVISDTDIAPDLPFGPLVGYTGLRLGGHGLSYRPTTYGGASFIVTADTVSNAEHCEVLLVPEHPE